MAITSKTNVKSYLGITDSANDTIIDTLVTQVDKFIKNYCGRVKLDTSSQLTEYRDGDGTDRIDLDEWPIASVTSLYDDVDRVFSSDSLIASTDYIIYENEGYIRLFNNESTFAIGKRNIKITYTAGYSTVPDDLVLAANKMVANLFNRRGADGLVQESLGSYGATYNSRDLPDDIRQILDTYRRVVV